MTKSLKRQKHKYQLYTHWGKGVKMQANTNALFLWFNKRGFCFIPWLRISLARPPTNNQQRLYNRNQLRERQMRTFHRSNTTTKALKVLSSKARGLSSTSISNLYGNKLYIYWQNLKFLRLVTARILVCYVCSLIDLFKIQFLKKNSLNTIHIHTSFIIHTTDLMVSTYKS